MAESDATIVYVAYRTTALDLDWLPSDVPIVVVHNDDELDGDTLIGRRVEHIRGQGNVGFGAAVNLALDHVRTDRVVLCNPDVWLDREHWAALSTGAPYEVVTIPLLDGDGIPTSVVNRYPGPAALLLTAFRLGRFAPRGSRRRSVVALLLGRWGRAHAASLDPSAGPKESSLLTTWASGAACAFDTQRLRAVGGFDPAYFLYFEDVDLATRLAARFPDMTVRVVNVAPGRHAVGASSEGGGRAVADAHLLRGAHRYASSRTGAIWRAVEALLARRSRRLGPVDTAA
jgi:GT2 family glycosyltransferase